MKPLLLTAMLAIAIMVSSIGCVVIQPDRCIGTRLEQIESDVSELQSAQRKTMRIILGTE